MIRNGLFSSESVSEGHPDQLADRISNRVLDAFLVRDPRARAACEAPIAGGLVVVAGEFRTARADDFDAVRAGPEAQARAVPRATGYRRADTGIDSDAREGQVRFNCSPHGGAFSGMDPSKVDRSAAYRARFLAKQVVARGRAQRALVQLACAIGVAEAVAFAAETCGTAADRRLDLARPIHQPTAARGHFGRPDIAHPREATRPPGDALPVTGAGAAEGGAE